ncbi:major surface protease gp63, putative [Leishmania tarentolae]|uniref:Leishmanolysin n=1 Tax=Leishmania tarentolae TaxID=5689 RepID=A0A640KWG6_LEITA|nr:major surface protease gp63, putative [Leishmania tarentolae]
MEKNITKWPKMFCDGTLDGILCPTDRLRVGTCGIESYSTPLPDYCQYFMNASLGGYSPFLDYCPFILGYSSGSCNEGGASAGAFFGAFNVFSDAARCIDGDFRPKRSQGSMNSYAGLCANVRCDTATHTYSVQVRGSTRYVNCTPGLRVELSTVSDAFEPGGYITCPPYVEVCQGNRKGALDFAGACDNASSSDDAADEESWQRWSNRMNAMATVARVLLGIVLSVMTLLVVWLLLISAPWVC